MPAPVKITKEMIIKASVELLKMEKELSTRNIAKFLNCSTQPIYSIFKNMDELEEELCKTIQQIHIQKVNEYVKEGKYPKYKAYGMGFVKFAKEEKELFRFLYMKKSVQLADTFQEDYLDEVASVIQNLYGLSKKQALAFHLDMIIYSYGLATLQYLGKNLTEEEVSERLSSEFNALRAQYNLMENRK